MINPLVTATELAALLGVSANDGAANDGASERGSPRAGARCAVEFGWASRATAL